MFNIYTYTHIYITLIVFCSFVLIIKLNILNMCCILSKYILKLKELLYIENTI